MFDCGMGGHIELEQCSVQIAPWKQQAQSLPGNSNAVDLKPRPHLSGSAKHPVRIKHHQRRLMIEPVGDSCGDDLLSAIAIQIGQHHGTQAPRMPVLRDCFTIGIQDRDLARPPGIMLTCNDDSGWTLLRCLQCSKSMSPRCGRTSGQLWQFTPGRELPELAGSPPTYGTHALGVLKATEKRPARIVVASQHNPWWPGQIAVLDSNGKTISEYWHSGGLSSMVLADLDGDGREEIIATGVANGFDHQATFVVLDPDRVFGASTEVRPGFQIHGVGVARERLRLLFPRSDLNRALFQFNMATHPTVEHGIVRLTVLECISPPGCRIWYEFDKNFRLIAAYAGSDEFRSAHARFYQTGKQAHPLTEEEQAAFQKVRCLVGCKTEFVPVGNLVP